MEAISTKGDVDDVITYNIDKVVCLRFGNTFEQDTVRLDDLVRASLV